ncbi:hypothetical protein MM221_00390 [Salipaludibacillus sp. LMS25]|uniref:MotE family protein n=1 Tax=Salipaludibacillus sp. LMS25 TaxID=2924031 RepID=UPI0020D081E2|nr:hypothetical protein [Salipaludibacillus sp. LMS25]UTR15097.1 hypothetical protein MM221_00390 [Salipaludibacillus sp. LMS25]
MSKKNKQKEKSQSKFMAFFMVVLIPAVFAIILAVVLLYYLGINVGDTVKQAASFLPFIEEEEERELSDEELVAQLEHENKSFSQQIQQLESELEARNEEIADLEEQLSEEGSDGLSDEEIEGAADLEEVTTDVNDIVKTLENMTGSKAADIVGELPEDEAVTYLRLMNVNSRSDILGRLDPELAARILGQLSN